MLLIFHELGQKGKDIIIIFIIASIIGFDVPYDSKLQRNLKDWKIPAREVKKVWNIPVVMGAFGTPLRIIKEHLGKIGIQTRDCRLLENYPNLLCEVCPQNFLNCEKYFWHYTSRREFPLTTTMCDNIIIKDKYLDIYINWELKKLQKHEHDILIND